MNVRYVNSFGEIINLTKWPLMLSEPERLFGNEWSYSTTSGGKINSFKKETTSKDVTVQVFANSNKEYKDLLNDLTRITEVDVGSETLGRLEIGDYHLPCYITAWEYDEYEEDFYATNKKITVVAEKWNWIKSTLYKFIHEDVPDISGRGYPYGYNYDYALGKGYMQTLNNEHFASCDFVMKIFGYAYVPEVTIGGHVYKVNEVVQQNETLIIDSKSKSITLIKNNGVKVNCFAKRDKDKSNYFFEKIPAGENKVYWNSGFDFEIELYEERGEPKWT